MIRQNKGVLTVWVQDKNALLCVVIFNAVIYGRKDRAYEKELYKRRYHTIG